MQRRRAVEAVAFITQRSVIDQILTSLASPHRHRGAEPTSEPCAGDVGRDATNYRDGVAAEGMP